jgi:ribonuclease R
LISQPHKNNFPTKEDVLAFIGKEAGNVGTREIARAFGLKNADRAALKTMLRDLADEGHIEKRRKKLHHAGSLPSVVLADITGRDTDGELIGVPAEWDTEAHGDPPKIRLHVPRRARPAEVPGVGDKALVRIEKSTDGEGADYRGRAIKVLDRAKHRVLGVFRRTGDGGRLVPIDKKSLGRELSIAASAVNGAEEGDLVAVEVARNGRLGLPNARVVERLGSLASEKAVSLIAIHAHGIPHEFRRETLDEAKAAHPAGLDHHREDWREVPFVTIDPVDAKDHDDAVYARLDTDPKNPGGFVVDVAIADVAHYVTPGSALDREALGRGNSVYFPDRVVPMLPERISNDLCSLREREERPCLAARMVFDRHGNKKSHTFLRGMMRSAAKLSYQEAQAAIDGRPSDRAASLLEAALKPLWSAYAALAAARDRRAPLDLDLPERKIVLDDQGRVERVMTPERLEAHRLIEEFMIQANVAAAETLEARRSAVVYRVHDAPSKEKLTALREFLDSLGLKLPGSATLRAGDFNRVLQRAKSLPSTDLVNEVVLRSQAQAVYAAENLGHFGLNLRRYAHFTSPIRRYADLLVHRSLIRALGLGAGALVDEEAERLADIAQAISDAERRAMAAERETNDRLIAAYLSERVGAEFDGRISGVTRAGLFVRLRDTGADGFVPAATIGGDYWRHHEDTHALIGDRTGEAYRLGDTVRVKLVEAIPTAGALRFEMLSDGTRYGGAAGNLPKGKRFGRGPRRRPR